MVLKISLDDINQSLKFSAFIAFGVLFGISLVQIILENTLFWQVIGVISGLIFTMLLTLVLIKVLRPVVKAMRQRRKKKKAKNQRTFFEAVADLFRENFYFKIMAIIWFIIILIGLELAIRLIGLIESQQVRLIVLANFGFTIITVSTALFIFNFSRMFKRRKRTVKKEY